MTESEILAKMQARAEGLPFRVTLTSPEQRDLFARELDRAMGDVQRAQQSVGMLNQRNSGIVNDLIQSGKRLTQRTLSWYTRSLQEFGAALSSALQSHTIAIKHMAYSLERTGRQVEEASLQNGEDIHRLQQSLESDIRTIAGRASNAETASLRNQEELLQVKARLERELNAIRKETEVETQALHELKREVDRLRSSR